MRKGSKAAGTRPALTYYAQNFSGCRGYDLHGAGRLRYSGFQFGVISNFRDKGGRI